MNEPKKEKKKKENIAPEVYTMPEKYIAPQKSKKTKDSGGAPKSGSKTWIIIVVIVVFLFLIFGGVGAYLYVSLNNQSEEVLNNINKNSGVVINTNTDENENENDNENVNTNINENDNINSNENENDNINVNENANSNFNTNINQEVDVISSTDSDNDNLTDKEEKLYDTKSTKPDTDGDGYLDGEEVKGGYNPNGEGTIEKLDKITVYENEKYGYSVNYPNDWVAEALNEEMQMEVLFTSDTGEFMETIVQDNPQGLSAEAWYKAQFPESALESLTKVKVGNLDGIVSLQGFTVYFYSDDYIYAITYKYGTKKEVNFINTFEMMYKSFKIFTPQVAPISSNSNNNNNSNNNSNENSNINSNTNSNTNTNSNENKLPF